MSRTVAAAAQPALQEHNSGRCRKDEAVTRYIDQEPMAADRGDGPRGYPTRTRQVRTSNFADYIGLLARFGEPGWFGGLAPFSCAREGHENRAVPEGKFLYFPP